MPKVSVLTSIYNTNHEHLREMIESVLNQTFRDFEFLILNDSPENVELDSIVKSYKDKRIVYMKNAKNMGISGSRNKLLHLAKGEYLAILDHDDVCMPDRLKREVEFLDSHPDVGVVSAWVRVFGTRSAIWQNPETDYEIKSLLTNQCAMWHTAAMIRRSVLFDNEIEYESYFSPAEDYRLWTRLMDVTNFYNIPDVLVRYRWSGDNTSIHQKHRMMEKDSDIKLAVREKHPYFWYLHRHDCSTDTVLRLYLFGFLPIIKVKKNWVKLFGFIPLFKIKWE